MRPLTVRPLGQWLALLVVGSLLLSLGACGDLASALPPRPSPVPTLARLPSVTPATPSATRPPAPPTPIVTPTTVPLSVLVAIAANVRAGPGLTFAVVGGFDAGTLVHLQRQHTGWFHVIGPGELTGWVFGQVLELDPATEAAVPTDTP